MSAADGLGSSGSAGPSASALGPTHVLLLANAKSGRGRGRAAAQHFADGLRRAGRLVAVMPVGRGTDPSQLRGQIARAQAVVVAGGDGSVHHAAVHAAAAGVPIYHLPWGNENLFARDFAMDRRVETLLAALREGRKALVDLAEVRVGGVDLGVPGAGVAGGSGVMVAGRPFVIMLSLGPDASVIHRVQRSRSRAVGHLAYLIPMLAEVRRPTFPRLTVRIDGRLVVEGGRGLLVVGNSRRYAVGLDPARRARLDDGRLDVVFMPAGGCLAALGWALRCKLGVHLAAAGMVYRQGAQVEIVAEEGPTPWQVDGEEGGTDDRLTLTVRRRALPVLLPPKFDPVWCGLDEIGQSAAEESTLADEPTASEAHGKEPAMGTPPARTQAAGLAPNA